MIVYRKNLISSIRNQIIISEFKSAVAILDKADGLNAVGGPLFTDITSAMHVSQISVPTVNYIYGIGGRDTKSDDIESVYNDLQEIAKTGKIDNPYRYLGLRK